jgi:hypothetical protein
MRLLSTSLYLVFNKKEAMTTARTASSTRRRRHHRLLGVPRTGGLLLFMTVWGLSHRRSTIRAFSYSQVLDTKNKNYHRPLPPSRRFQATTAASHLYSSSSLSDFNDNASWSPPLYLPDDATRRRPIRTVMAPMVAASDYAFRCLCRQYNKNHKSSEDDGSELLVFTQMIHAAQFVKDSSFSKSNKQRLFRDNHLDLYEYDTDECRPPSERQSLIPSQCHFLQGSEQLLSQHTPYFHDFLTVSSSFLDHPTTTGGSSDSSIHRKARKGPVILQLAGHDPDTVLRAALAVLDEVPVAGIDLNVCMLWCGCVFVGWREL